MSHPIHHILHSNLENVLPVKEFKESETDLLELISDIPLIKTCNKIPRVVKERYKKIEEDHYLC